MQASYYQDESRKTNRSPENVDPIMYFALCLNGEAGEMAEKVKKVVRDKASEYSPEDKQEIAKEIGDVLWYIARLADSIEIPLEEIMQMNLDKVFSRKARGKLGGSGDNR